MALSYDEFGRPDLLTYPESPGAPGGRFAVRHGYTPSGFLQSVTDVSSPMTPQAVWQAGSRNAVGQLLTETFGSGADEELSSRVYDPVTSLLSRIDTAAGGTPLQKLAYQKYDRNWNLEERKDEITGVTERFGYDHMDRLSTWERIGSGGWRVSYGHDELGNLTSRTFDPLGSPGTLQAVTYRHEQTACTGRSPAGPHAVTSALEGGAIGAGSEWASYCYDARGNQISGPGGRAITWSNFDLPRQISGPREASFKYDASGTRVWKSVDGGRRTTYIGGLFEQREEGGATTYVFYVQGAEGVAAQIERKASGETRRYMHADHLGTPETVSTPGDAGGGLGVERKKFDPFGNRLADLASPRLDTSAALPMSGGDVTAGFTGHEGDDELGLVNMRGRIFDPKVGKFLTADPFVQAPFFGQSYNRYAYAMGNPINFVDPSGFADEERDRQDFCKATGGSLSADWYCGRSTGGNEPLDDSGAGARLDQIAWASENDPMMIAINEMFENAAFGHLDDLAANRKQKGEYHLAQAIQKHERRINDTSRRKTDLPMWNLEWKGMPPEEFRQLADLYVKLPLKVGELIASVVGAGEVAEAVIALGRGALRGLSALREARRAFGRGSLGAAEVKVLQTGGNTITRATARALNEQAGRTLSRREWGRALEELKRENELPAGHHGRILGTGEYTDEAGNVVGNIFDYIKGGL